MKNILIHLFICSILFLFFAACGDNTRKPANDSNQDEADTDVIESNDDAKDDETNDFGTSDNEINDTETSDTETSDGETDDNETGDCGNGSVEGNEVCDGDVKNCVDIDPSKYNSGKAKCNSSCDAYDIVTCEEKIEVLFSDGFESESDKWILGGDWEIGLPYYDISGVTLTEAATGDGVLATKLTQGYTIKINSTATIAEDIVIPETGNYVLTFSAYVNTDFDVPSENGDANWFDGMVITYISGSDAEAELAVTSDDTALVGAFKALIEGTNYEIMTGIRGTSANNTYSDFSVDLSSLAGRTVTINFKFYSDTVQGGTGAFPGIYIDDVLIALQ